MIIPRSAPWPRRLISPVCARLEYSKSEGRGMLVHRMTRFAFASMFLLAPASGMAQPAPVRQACGAEIQQHCTGLQPGEGRIRACVKEHFAEFSEPCKQALIMAKFGKR